ISLIKKDDNLQDVSVKEEKLKEILEKEYPTNEYTGIGAGKNLIVIQVEALQNFVLFEEINGFEITPNLNKLVKDSGTLYYDNFFQLVGKGNTSDAEVAILNSL
ncbi:LTA synthase family protein, partial [Vibrio parahaemolyticus]|nr:LTA synthase family protein [Vibrio parahaemolyticus]